MLLKISLVILIIFLYASPLLCQTPRKNFDPDSLSENYFTGLKKEYGKNKQYPKQFEKQILIALSYYPELKNTPILFRTRVRHTPATTRATWAGVFETRGKRHFVITISDSTEPMLMPLLFKHLPFNAQVGVMGHELAHVSDFSRMVSRQIIGHAIKNISAKYIDKFEYNTDAICIAHGLGYQLLSWSSFVRKKMNRENWDGPDYAHRPMTKERYMNPSTIEKRIAADPIYKETR
ncbi:MAG: hypothetical protein Q8941_20345 [Bacteroidota bacterium]|nr:hypothetical protein [Bacteroidota bacterium]